MIVFTGATGLLGRAIVGALIERVSPGEVCASARDPAKHTPPIGLRPVILPGR